VLASRDVAKDRIPKEGITIRIDSVVAFKLVSPIIKVCPQARKPIYMVVCIIQKGLF
jgi:hypothetical protein